MFRELWVDFQSRRSPSVNCSRIFRIDSPINFLEPLKSLGNKDPANSEEKRDFVKTATSNLAVNQKPLVYSWRSPFFVLAARQETSYGVPHRGTSRTLHNKSTKQKRSKAVKRCQHCTAYSQLAEKIMTGLDAGSASDVPNGG